MGEAYFNFSLGRFFVVANIAQGSRQGGGGAVATSNPTGVAWNGYLGTNMVLLFWENKIRFSCVKI